MSKTIFMETTEVSSEKTAGELSQLLMSAGASKIMTDCENGATCGLTFGMKIGEQEMGFRLPIRVEPIFQMLKKRRGRWTRGCEQRDREQAVRIAWRQAYRWAQAQIAMIQTGMVKTDEVFMPYVLTRGGRTLYESFQLDPSRLLESK